MLFCDCGVFWLYTTTPLFVPFGWFVVPLPCCDKTMFTWSWWCWYICCDVSGWIDTFRLLSISLILRRVAANDVSSSNEALCRSTLLATRWLSNWMPSKSPNSLLLNVSIMAWNLVKSKRYFWSVIDFVEGKRQKKIKKKNSTIIHPHNRLETKIRHIDYMLEKSVQHLKRIFNNFVSDQLKMRFAITMNVIKEIGVWVNKQLFHNCFESILSLCTLLMWAQFKWPPGRQSESLVIHIVVYVVAFF